MISKLSKLLTAFFVLVLPFALFAEENSENNNQNTIQQETTTQAENTTTSKQEDRTTKFRPIVLPFYDPSIKAGIQAIPMIAFYPSDKDLVSNASTVYMPFIYTTNGSYVAKVGGDFIFFEDKVRVSLMTGFANINTNFVDTKGTVQNIDFDGDVYYKVAKNLYLGVGGVYQTSRYRGETAEETSQLVAKGYNSDYEDDAGYRLSVKWDTREHYYYPYGGFSVYFSFEDHPGWLGNQDFERYQALYGDYKHFWSLMGNNNHIIAYKVSGRYLLDAENAPASSYTMYGRQSREIQRGFMQGEYIASNMFNTEVEYRHKFESKNDFVNRSTLVLIGGAGKSFGQKLGEVRYQEKFVDSKWLGMVGVGYRYAFLPYERINIKVDVTQSTDGNTLIYFGLGESIQ